jgi:hypothetical protein
MILSPVAVPVFWSMPVPSETDDRAGQFLRRISPALADITQMEDILDSEGGLKNSAVEVVAIDQDPGI